MSIESTNTGCCYSIKPRALVVATPQDTVVSLASPPADFVHPQIAASSESQVHYLGAEPSHRVPISFQYDLDDLNTQAEDIFSLTNNSCQSYAGQYNPDSFFLPPSSSTSSLSMEHGVEPYHWQQCPDPITQYIIPQTNPPYESYASSAFPQAGDSVNNIYAEIPGSSHLMMSANLNDGTLTGLTLNTLLPFPDYHPNDFHSYK